VPCILEFIPPGVPSPLESANASLAVSNSCSLLNLAASMSTALSAALPTEGSYDVELFLLASILTHYG
jgi:hypothetical protein